MQIRRKNRSGRASDFMVLHTPWDVVVALQTLLHFWTQLLFGRGGLMHVVCVCGTTGVFASLGLNCLLAGRSDALRGDDIYRHKVVMDITFAAWCEVNIEFAERLFCVKLWMLGFWFWYVRKECQKICQKACRKICQKECQKICQKECQKICQKECQKICQKRCQKECQKICQKECQKIYQKICQKECQKICQKETSRRLLPVSLRSWE